MSNSEGAFEVSTRSKRSHREPDVMGHDSSDRIRLCSFPGDFTTRCAPTLIPHQTLRYVLQVAVNPFHKGAQVPCKMAKYCAAYSPRSAVLMCHEKECHKAKDEICKTVPSRGRQVQQHSLSPCALHEVVIEDKANAFIYVGVFLFCM